MAKFAACSSNGINTDTANTLSTKHEAQEDVRRLREGGRTRILKIGVVQLCLGCAAMLVGILSLVYGVPTESFPFFLGVPLWGGVFVLLAGTFAVLAGKQSDEANGTVSTKEKCMVIGNYVMTLMSLILSIAMPVFGGLGIHYCLNPGSTVTSRIDNKYYTTVIYCEPNRDANLALSGVTLALGIIIVLISLPVLGFFCCYARVYGFQSRQQQRLEMMRMQQQINKLEQQINGQNIQNSTKTENRY